MTIRALFLISTLCFHLSALAATWFVDSRAASGGDGSLERPFRTLREAQEASAAGDGITVARGSGPYRESIALKERQTFAAAAEPATEKAPILAPPSGGAAIVARNCGGIAIRDMTIELAGDASGLLLDGMTGAVAMSGGRVQGTSSGTAVRVQGGSAAMVFENVSVTGAIARGIAIARSKNITLRNMTFAGSGSANGVAATICGNPTATGEHLACGAAIHLHEVEGITLERVRIDDSAQTAIAGDTVRDLTMSGVEIRGAGDETHEHGVQLRNAAGTLRLTECKIDGSEARQLYVINDAGEVSVEIRKSSFRGGPPPNGQQAILLQTSGDARLRLVVDASQFSQHFSNAIQMISAGASGLDAEITGNTFRGAAAAVAAMANDASKLTYRIAANKIANATSTALNIHGTTSAEVTGAIVDNVIGVAGKRGSGASCGGGCSGISVTALGSGTSTAVISGNTIQQVDANGIFARAAGDATLRARITANVIREPAGVDVLHAISVNAGVRKADRAHVCADIGGAGDRANAISGSWNAAGGGGVIALARRGDSTSLTIAGYAGDRTSAANLAKFVAGRNKGGAVDASIGAGVMIVECPLP